MKPLDPAARPYFRAFYEGNHLNYALAILFTLLSMPINLAVSWLLGELLDAASSGNMTQLTDAVKYVVIVCILPGSGTIYPLGQVQLHPTGAGTVQIPGFPQAVGQKHQRLFPGKHQPLPVHPHQRRDHHRDQLSSNTPFYLRAHWE